MMPIGKALGGALPRSRHEHARKRGHVLEDLHAIAAWADAVGEAPPSTLKRALRPHEALVLRRVREVVEELAQLDEADAAIVRAELRALWDVFRAPALRAAGPNVATCRA